MTDHHKKQHPSRIQYHPAFASGLELLLWDYRFELNILTEYNLNRKPLQIDIVIVRKTENTIVNLDIGRLFRVHNIIEYKSPQDALNIDSFCKTQAYALLYKSMGSAEGRIPANSISVSIFRHTRPGKLFTDLNEYGCKVTKKFNGIYYIEGPLAPFPTQVIVTCELEDPVYSVFKILTPGADKQDILAFTAQTAGHDDDGYKRNADAVYQVSICANRSLYDKIRKEEPDVCEALRDLFKDDLIRERNDGFRQGISQGEIIGTIKTYARMNFLPSEILHKIMDIFSLSSEEAADYMKRVLHTDA